MPRSPPSSALHRREFTKARLDSFHFHPSDIPTMQDKCQLLRFFRAAKLEDFDVVHRRFGVELDHAPIPVLHGIESQTRVHLLRTAFFISPNQDMFVPITLACDRADVLIFALNGVALPL